MTLREKEDTGSVKRKHWVVLSGDLRVEESLDLS
jgi:hypothetical protein